MWHLRGTLLPEGEVSDLWIAEGMIVDGPVHGAETIDLGDCYILPGLVDAHCHIGLGAPGAVDRQTAYAQALTDRNSGVLLIRDAGAPVDTHWMDEDPALPRIIRAGRHIAREKRYIRNFAAEVEPDDLVAEVERQAKRGDGWIKLVGDWIDRRCGDLAPLWPKDRAAEAIAKAHEMGVKVTAHCFAEESVAQLVEAGIDCIEHGTGLSDEVIAAMAERSVALVPTMTNLENFPIFAAAGEAKFPRYSAHMRDLHARRFDTLRAAHEAGVAIYAGTDAGGTLCHGRIAEEAELLAKLVDNDFALNACSWGARRWLGAEELKVGHSADLIVTSKDPRQGVSALRAVELVMLRGSIVSYLPRF